MDICWKHKRQLWKDGTCSDCNGKPPQMPKAYSDSIKKASIALSYAFGDIKNEGQRQSVVEYWEDQLRHLIQIRGYEIIEVEVSNETSSFASSKVLTEEIIQKYWKGYKTLDGRPVFDNQKSIPLSQVESTLKGVDEFVNILLKDTYPVSVRLVRQKVWKQIITKTFKKIGIR